MKILKPIGPWVEVEVVQEDVTLSSSSVVLLDTSESSRLGFCKARVLKVGTGYSKYKHFGNPVLMPLSKRQPLPVEPGDFVYYRKHLTQANPTERYDLDSRRCLIHAQDIEVVIRDVKQSEDCNLA